MKRFFLLVAFAVCLLPAGAQNLYHRRIPPMPYAHVERNALKFPGGASADFDAFLRKLDTLVVTGRGDVRILHIGGSHVRQPARTPRWATRPPTRAPGRPAAV